MALDQHDTRPRHMQVTDDLRKRIQSGEFPVGAKMPSLRALVDYYSVSEVTAHTAIRALQQEGVLESTSGRGTFVRSALEEAASRSVQAQIDELRSELRTVNARLEVLESHAKQSTPKPRRKP
ncbi:MAG: GntR family transcriptional regulator [Pseudonocardiaceae bacterium]|nr:GntR family transcriptional regulator [Pseudonocardiaceae bacterium]